MSTRLFISYAHRDGGGLAARLQRDLQAQGFDVWLDKHRLLGGDVWTKEIELAIDRCDVALALLSTGSYESDICRAEQQRSLAKRKPVIPVRVQCDCDVPLPLQTRQHVDFSRDANYPESLHQLLTSIRKNLGVIAPPDPQPRYNPAPPPARRNSSSAAALPQGSPTAMSVSSKPTSRRSIPSPPAKLYTPPASF